MNNAPRDLREMILRECAAAAPLPWYPKSYAERTSTPRDILDLPLEELRTKGYVQLTEWVPGNGQGYLLTAAGKQFVASQAVSALLQTIRLPYVALTLLAVNFIFFGFEIYVSRQKNLALADHQVILAAGAVVGDELLLGDRWRLLACCFVHIGVIHLVMNMVMLLDTGVIAERLWGRWQFLVIYLASGFAGSSAAMVVQPNAITAGASGAIWGIMVSVLLWLLLHRRSLDPGLARRWIRIVSAVLIVNLGLTLGFREQVSAPGHLGGGAAGCLVGLFLHVYKNERLWLRLIAALGIVLVPLLSFSAIAIAPHVDSRWHGIAQRVVVHELQEFEGQLVFALRAGAAADQHYKRQVRPLVVRRPSRRAPEDVTSVIELLKSDQIALQEARDHLSKIGPFHTQKFEAMRQALIEELAEQERLDAMSETYFQEGSYDYGPLDEQTERLELARQRYQEARAS